ncbi:hypothetical protein HNR42_002529 [Deinobacterium chartae]|uniref:PE cleavage protein A C-terminal domain-containing protein n=1 Tax=Deinobacterium chartae TaxID=521158 RepID=A0A841I1H9_9DEIO|nr:hypothetical protein [Deinobacterium chartae]MBB6099093.1 hypothetical protein [Deinobacterium chartae]
MPANPAPSTSNAARTRPATARRTPAFVLGALGVLSALLAGCGNNPPAPKTLSYELPLSERSSVSRGLHLDASVAGGQKIGVMIDTGSTGIVIARRYIGQNYTSLNETFSNFTYSSSGNSYSGEWVRASVRLSSPQNGTTAETVPMKIRVVDKFCNAQNECVTDPDKIHVSMMGVGFDRIDPHGTVVDPSLNPFLNLQEMAAGTMAKGYILTPRTITLGVTAANSQNFEFVKLKPLAATATQPADWQAPTACIAVPTANIAPQCGPLLIDTGLNYSIVQVPEGINPPLVQDPSVATRQRVAQGQRIVITVPELNKTLYQFTVGDASSGAPDWVVWGHNTTAHAGQSFMNTSMHTLSQLDYLYDADSGRLGFRFHAVAP